MKTTSPVCPLCHNSASADSGAVFRSCRKCGAVINLNYTPVEYSDSYFTDDYQKQYGQTYFEDFENIYSLSQKRIDYILKILRKNRGIGISEEIYPPLSLVDIGSAAGFFLKCALDNGFEYVKGVEISSFAAQYAKDRFGFDVDVKPFVHADIGLNYDVITAWYYIEHSPDPLGDFKRIYYSLKRGGVFAFSAPSVFGPMYQLHRKTWEETHPVDHLVDFSPKTAVKILKSIGFRSVTLRPAGIHPNRVLAESSLFFPVFSWLYARLSRFFVFSDTIEVYAVK